MDVIYLSGGITFEIACEVFFDELAEYVSAGTDGEERQAIIGLTRKRKLLFVVHLEREENRVRIISAREVDEREMKRYAYGE